METSEEAQVQVVEWRRQGSNGKVTGRWALTVLDGRAVESERYLSGEK